MYIYLQLLEIYDTRPIRSGLILHKELHDHDFFARASIKGNNFQSVPFIFIINGSVIVTSDEFIL